MPSISELRRGSEEQRLAVLRHAVDDVCRQMVDGRLDEEGARELASRLRFQAGLLIPDQLHTYDMIYGARLDRLIDQFVRGRS
ncbi:hypothetical protein ACFL6X_06015 [Candidatus Latescibacterota bacterium]